MRTEPKKWRVSTEQSEYICRSGAPFYLYSKQYKIVKLLKKLLWLCMLTLSCVIQNIYYKITKNVSQFVIFEVMRLKSQHPKNPKTYNFQTTRIALEREPSRSQSIRRPIETRKQIRKKYIFKIRQKMREGYTHHPKKYYQQKLSQFVQTKNQELSVVSISSLSCPICIDILMNPSSTACGHTFCFKCIEELLMRQGNCPVCRKPTRVQQISESYHLNEINQSIWRRSNKWQCYQQKSKQNQDWINQRFISRDAIKQGEIIDIRDTEYIWCKAKIIQVYQNSEGYAYGIKVHYLGWNAIYDEFLDIDSQRLAPKGFFTHRIDIPHYEHPSLADESYRCRINYGQTTRELFDPQRRERNNQLTNNDIFGRRFNPPFIQLNVLEDVRREPSLQFQRRIQRLRLESIWRSPQRADNARRRNHWEQQNQNNNINQILIDLDSNSLHEENHPEIRIQFNEPRRYHARVQTLRQQMRMQNPEGQNNMQIEGEQREQNDQDVQEGDSIPVIEINSIESDELNNSEQISNSNNSREESERQNSP